MVNTYCDLNLNDNDEYTALHYAARKGEVDTIKLILDTHCNLDLKDNDGCTALHYSVRNSYITRIPYHDNNVNVAKLLLDTYYNPDFKNKNESIALFSAIYFYILDIIEMLLDRDANIFVKDISKKTIRNILKIKLLDKVYSYKREKVKKTK